MRNTCIFGMGDDQFLSECEFGLITEHTGLRYQGIEALAWSLSAADSPSPGR